jgi:hypothetical protein
MNIEEEEEEEEEETPPVESMHNSCLFSKKFKKVAKEEGRLASYAKA